METIEWKETTEERFWEMLGVLPPAIMLKGAFLVGEPYDHNDIGYPRFQGFRQEGEKFFESSRPITHAEFKKEIAHAIE